MHLGPPHRNLWIFYLLGAGLSLVWKLGSWIVQGKKKGQTFKQSLIEWFSLELSEDKISWVTTIGAVWAMGSIFIEKVVDVPGISEIPAVDSFAFLFGSLMEFAAPALVKYIVSKLPK